MLMRNCWQELHIHALSPVFHVQHDQVELEDALHDDHFLLFDPCPHPRYLASVLFERERRSVALNVLLPPRVQTFRDVHCHNCSQEPLGLPAFHQRCQHPSSSYLGLVRSISAMHGQPHQPLVEVEFNRRPPRLRNAAVEAVPVLGCTFAMPSRVRCPARGRADMIVIRVKSTPKNITLI